MRRFSAPRPIQNFCEDGDLPPRRVSMPTLRRNPRASIQSFKSTYRSRHGSSWLDDADTTYEEGAAIQHLRQHKSESHLHEPFIRGVLDIPASATPWIRTLPTLPEIPGRSFEEPRHASLPTATRYDRNRTFDEGRSQSLRLNSQEECPSLTDADSASDNEWVMSPHREFANFLSADIFQAVLHDSTASRQLAKFCQSSFCGEKMEFLGMVKHYNALIDELGTTMMEVHKNFISVHAPSQLNLSNEVLIKTNDDLKSTLGSALPEIEDLFSLAQGHAEDHIFAEVYPSFVRHQLISGTSKALSSNRDRYPGLGSSFVLTDPERADNPISFVSDAFWDVTGYSRSEVITQNCRFLQGRHSDRAVARKLQVSIGNRDESVQLLLNYKKNGEPFWNLLHTAPLYDENGRLAFFLGGQIDCSSTIQNSSDILQILSSSQNTDDGTISLRPAPERKPSFRQTFAQALRRKSNADDDSQQGDTIPSNVSIKNYAEMSRFAYSKYLVIKYDTMMIRFSSAGVELMHGTEPVVGTNVFSFLERHAVDMSRYFRTRAKTSLKAGQSISLELNLRAGQLAKNVGYTTHWTPLKDESGKVCYVVVVLSSW